MGRSAHQRKPFERASVNLSPAGTVWVVELGWGVVAAQLFKTAEDGDREGRDFSLFPMIAPSHWPRPVNCILLAGRRRGHAWFCTRRERKRSAISWSGVTTSPGRRSSTMLCLSQWAPGVEVASGLEYADCGNPL